MPVRSATLIQISGTSTPSKSRQATFTPIPLPGPGFYHIAPRAPCAPRCEPGPAAPLPPKAPFRYARQMAVPPSGALLRALAAALASFAAGCGGGSADGADAPDATPVT